MRTFALSLGALMTISSSSHSFGQTVEALVEGETHAFASYDPHHPPPRNEPSVFSLSQDYPQSPGDVEEPWKAVDFRSRPEEYLDAVLEYSLDGNIEIDFRVQENTIRKWYHAPWLHDDGLGCGNGREYLHGLTRERGSPPFEIHRQQSTPLENWAVGFYNRPGGYTLGRVWKLNPELPDARLARFPEGTVTFKLLFTDGSIESVPYLDGSFEWEAHIYQRKPYRRQLDGSKECLETSRTIRTVRLLQVDVAVRDSRATETGWVFGTFIYDASTKGDSPWEKLVPVGLSWGNDPAIKDAMNRDGAFLNPSLQETWLNATLIESASEDYGNRAFVRFHGLGGRLNGPVDNPISSCMSCHGQAGIAADGQPMPMANFRHSRATFTEEDFDSFFSNVAPGSYERDFQGTKYWTTDYSLQLVFGIRNFFQRRTGSEVQSLALDIEDPPESLREVSRGEQEE